MSLQSALQFIQRIWTDDSLRERVAAAGNKGGPIANLDPIVQAAAEAGFAFTAEELDTAHRIDWGLRWARYGGDTTISPTHG